MDRPDLPLVPDRSDATALPRRRAFVLTLASLTLTGAAALAAPAGTPAELCAAAKNKAAFALASAQSKCWQRALRDSATVDAGCLAKAATKFAAAIAKADDEGGCLQTGDAGPIGDAIDTCMANVLDLTPGEVPVCALPSSCPVDDECLGFADNSALGAFGLRIAQIDVSAPASLASGPVGSTISNGTLPSLPDCNVSGSATFNWLLGIDTLAGTLRTGGAKPVLSPASGYSFVNEVAFGATMSPLTVSLGLMGDNSFSSATGDVTIPVYMNSTASMGIPLPLRGLRVTGQLSASKNCIGSSNAAAWPEPACLPDSAHAAFVDGGTLHAAIHLEDADALVVAPLNQSLCVLLSGNAAAYGDGGSPTHCLRSSGNIVLPGNYCSGTGTPGGCADSLEFSASYAASAILIHP